MTIGYKDAYDFLTYDGKKGEIDHDSAMQPFFTKAPEEGDRARQLDFESEETAKIIDANNIPTPLATLFKVIGHPSREYYFNNWILLNLNKIVNVYNSKVEKGQNNIIDFSVMYMGMGHCIVCAMDPRDKKVFYRHDGGSNGWERQHNYEKIVTYDSNSGKKFSFKHWMDLTKQTDKDPFEINDEFCIKYC